MARTETFSINGREYPITDHTYDVVAVSYTHLTLPTTPYV